MHALPRHHQNSMACPISNYNHRTFGSSRVGDAARERKNIHFAAENKPVDHTFMEKPFTTNIIHAPDTER